MHEPLALPDPIADVEFLLPPLRILGDNDLNWLARGLLGRIAVHPGRGIVPVQDPALQILRHDRVVGVLHDRREMLLKASRPPGSDRVWLRCRHGRHLLPGQQPLGQSRPTTCHSDTRIRAAAFTPVLGVGKVQPIAANC